MDFSPSIEKVFEITKSEFFEHAILQIEKIVHHVETACDENGELRGHSKIREFFEAILCFCCLDCMDIPQNVVRQYADLVETYKTLPELEYCGPEYK